jgi:hypothetical protein
MQGIAQKILAQPGKYSIQQLTQAVQNGTLPAYIGVPIIQDKVQQQKQSQMMQQGQQAQQNAPPIAQQVMQEAQGLEALPSNLPQEYAGGGIVAFEEGGEVERYQNQGLVGTGEIERNRVAEAIAKLRTYGLRQRQLDPQGYAAAEQESKQAQDALFNLERNITGGPAGLLGRSMGIATPTATPAVKPYDPATATLRSQYTNEPYPTATNTGPANTDPAKAKPNANLGGDSALNRKPDFGLKDPGTFTRPPGKSMAAQTTEQLGGYDGADGYLERAAERDKVADAAIAEAKKSVTGEAFSDYKKVLEKEALDFGADKAQAKGMAIFKAGLAMMAGTSRNALENIGKGAMVGAEDYQAAAKDIKKAQQENRKELSLIEQARRAEARGDRDTAIARLDASRNLKDSRDRYVSDALQKAYGIDRDEAFKMATTNYTTRADIFRANLAGEFSLAGQHIAGGYGLKAAQTRANRESGITPYQMANLRVTAQKNVDPDAVRAQLAKSLGLTKTPAPGADKGFDSKFSAKYENEVASYINRILGAPGGGGGGGGGADPYAGYKLVP